MSARRSTGLTPDDLETLSAGLAAGKRVTVYLCEPMPALGLEAGASARVLSIDGSTVMVSPKGVDDQLPFEADELQKSRAAALPGPAARRRSVKTAAPPGPSLEPASPAPTKPKQNPAPAGASAEAKRFEPKPAPAKATRRTKALSAAVSVTVTSTGESAWTVSVLHGTKKQGKPTEVTADRVARAMRELGDDAAVTAVDGVIESAREAAQKRIAELSQELETARATLAHLDGQGADG